MMAYTNDNVVMKFISARAGNRSPIDLLRLVFENHLLMVIREFYVRTRDYEGGLALAEYSLAVIEDAKTGLMPREYACWSQQLLEFKFDMMDRLNDWKGYLALFDHIKRSYDYVYVEPYPRQWIDADCEEYVAYRVGKDIYMRFIYRIAWRQKVIRRKWEKFVAGKPVEHIKRHQRERLSEDEITRRIETLFDWYDISFD